MNNLVICSPQLGIAPESNSGGEVYDREIINALCERGIKVIVILPKNKPYLPHKNLKVYYLPFPFVWPPYLFNLLIIPWLFWLYYKEKFNLLRVHSPYFVGLGSLFFKLFYPSIPVVVNYHHLEEKKLFYDLIDRFFINKWDYLLCVSKFTKWEIQKKYKIPDNKISVVYNGVSNIFKMQQKDKNLLNKYQIKNQLVLVFLGGLKPRKNIGFILKVAAQLKSNNFKLLIGGSGLLKQQLIKQAKLLDIDNKIIFTGYIPEKEKVSFYNLTDIFLFPSKKEGFGMPVLEAAACAVPSIASNISSLKELIIDGRTGYLAKLNDINDWKLKIEKLLKNEDLRRKIGNEAQKFSQQFTWQKSAGKKIYIYKKLITKD